MEEIKPQKETQDPNIKEFIKEVNKLSAKYGYTIGSQLTYKENGIIPEVIIIQLSEEEIKRLKEKNEGSK